MGLGKFLRGWNDLAAKTEVAVVLENFCRSEIGLRIFLSEGKREEELDLENVCLKRQKGERQLDLKYFVQVKGEKKSKVRQVRRGVRNHVR